MIQLLPIVNQIKRLVKLSLFLMRVNWLLSRIVNRPIILGFHRIKKPSDSLIDRRVGVTDSDTFESIITYFNFLGYKFVSLDNLVNSRSGRLLAITFDDGFRD